MHVNIMYEFRGMLNDCLFPVALCSLLFDALLGQAAMFTLYLVTYLDWFSMSLLKLSCDCFKAVTALCY